MALRARLGSGRIPSLLGLLYAAPPTPPTATKPRLGSGRMTSLLGVVAGPSTPQAPALPYRPARQLGTYRPDEILNMLVLAAGPGIYQPAAMLGVYRPDEDSPIYRVARGT